MKVEPAPIMDSQKQIEAIQILTNPQLQPLFQKISDEYLYWDKVKYIAPQNTDKKVLWQAVKIQRKLNAQYVKFGNYNFHFIRIHYKKRFLPSVCKRCVSRWGPHRVRDIP